MTDSGPQKYDARCAHCREPYTFSNAKACSTPTWQRFCCRTCEQAKADHNPYRTPKLRRAWQEGFDAGDAGAAGVLASGEAQQEKP